MRPVVLMTRPMPDGVATAEKIARETGAQVILSPLLGIRVARHLPPIDPDATLIFTSRNGVRAYAELGGAPGTAICVGDATAELAQEMGHQATSAAGDADALVDHILADPPGQPLLHLRGHSMRGNITARLTEAGIKASEAVIYQQDVLPLTDAAKEALVGPVPVLVPLYSPRTAAQFAKLCPRDASVHIIAISQAAALAAAPLRANSLGISKTPDADAMAHAITATLERLEGQDPPD